MTGVAFVLFTFYMVTDPATTPGRGRGPGRSSALAVAARLRRAHGRSTSSSGCSSRSRIVCVGRGAGSCAYARPSGSSAGAAELAARRSRRCRVPAAEVAERELASAGDRHRRHGLPLSGRPHPAELWENVLAGRRAFRRLPAERMRRRGLLVGRPAPRRIGSTRRRPRSSKGTSSTGSRSGSPGAPSAPPTSPTGWRSTSPPRRWPTPASRTATGCRARRTGVVVGNTLTGEFSRADVLRLRWPYVRRVVDAALAERGLATRERRAFLDRAGGARTRRRSRRSTRTRWPAACPTPSPAASATTSTSRAAATPSTAPAPRRCSRCHACTALVAGDLDVALAGGVDLSLDPVRADRLRQDRRPGRGRDARLRRALHRASGPARAAAWWC